MWIIKRITSLWGKESTKREEASKDTWIWINIERNPSKRGKRYIAKMYKDWELIASYPADKISDIDLKFFNP